jgi:DNA-binding transcriptional LysR family regulator
VVCITANIFYKPCNMAARTDFDHIDLHLIRVLHTVITERSVSRAALRLQTSQPAVSAALRRLRAITGDVLLVRAGQGMMPTERALQLAGPAASMLQQAEAMFGRREAPAFDPRTSTSTVRVAASDYLDPLFLPDLVAHLKREAPGLGIEVRPLSAEFDYRRSLAAGEVDLVIGNWLQPPGELHLGRLFSDEVVCLVAERHPAARASAGRAWTVPRYLDSEHVAPTPLHPGASGVIDEHLAAQGLERRITVRSCHFGLIPLMVARSLLVLTTGRSFCARYTDTLPVRIVRCPVDFPPLTYYQLWHDLTHGSATLRWVREQVRLVARDIAAQRLPAQGARA